MHIESLGGATCVTGSCHLVRAGEVSLLVDCGAVQGNDPLLPMASWPVQPKDIAYLFLTHAHVDHCGRVPELVRAGFEGEILTTHDTQALLGPMLGDALGFTGWSEDDQARVLARIQKITWGFEYDRDFDLAGGLRFRLGQAGHILGSCFVRIEAQEEPDGPASVVFSGDLGPPHTPLLPDPAVPAPCDLLVMESTYGDRRHAERGEARIQRLGEILSHALQDQGKVYIPAFSLGRAQELLYEMDRLFSDPAWQARFPDLAPRGRPPVFLDSPLALDITRVYAERTSNWDCEARELLEAGDAPLDFPGLYAVRSHRDHQKLLAYDGPAVILAGSGMCTGGRIVNHLKQGLGDPRNDVLFVGYQAPGTPGRDLVEYSRQPGGYVFLEGERVDIRAQVHVLTGYSAHADQEDLVAWARAVAPGRLTLVHGDERAREALEKRLAHE